MGLIFIYTRAFRLSTELRKLNIPFLFSDKKQQREKTTMKEIITLVKGYIDDLVHLMISFPYQNLILLFWTKYHTFFGVFFRTPSLINIIICNVIFFFYALL